MKKYIWLIIVTLSEATIGVFVKLTGGNVPILTLNFYRVLFAFIFLVAVVPVFSKNFWKISKRNIKPVMIIGLFIALQISFFNLAMTMAPIANVVIFWSIAPFFVFIFTKIFTKEKVHKEHIFIFLIAFVGILVAKPLAGGYATGNIIALADGAIYAALVTYMRYEDKAEKTNLVCWYMLMAVIYLSPALLISGTGDLTHTIYYKSLGMNIPVIVWVVCLGMISTGIAYFFINLVLKKINASIYSLVDIIVSPIVAAFFGFLIFNEVPSINMVYGGALLLISGFWLSNHMSGHHSFLYKVYHKYFGKKSHVKVGENPIVENKQIK